MTNVQIIDAMLQARREQTQWHEANNNFARVTDSRAAYSAGFDQGWRAAISYLKLHKAIKLTDRETVR